MAATAAIPAERTAVRTAYPRIPLAVVAGIAGVLATLLRLVGLGRSLDIFGDEVIYATLGRSVRSGGFPTFDGSRFFLHPPGFFYLEAAWAHLFGYRSDVVANIYEMRALNAVLAGCTAFLLVVLVARAGSARTAVATGLLFALEPFCIRQNGRVLLETAMMFWVLAGYVVLIPLAVAKPPKKPLFRAICAGLLFGLGVLTKDEAALITVVPMLVAAALRWGPRQRSVLLLAGGVTALPYGIYVALVEWNGYGRQFWTQKTLGIRRLLGIVQITGFNSPGTPSLGGRLASEALSFGATYCLLAASVAAFVLIVRRGDRPQRLVALVYASAVVYLAYALVLGTLEEQALYVLLVPALATLGLAAALLERRYSHNRRIFVIALSLLAVVLAVNINTYLQSRVHPDDGYAQLRRYMAAHISQGSAIDAADDSISALILSDRYDVGHWVSAQERARENVHYAVVPWGEIDQGYYAISPSAVHRLIDRADPVFSFRGPSYGLLVLYRLPSLRDTSHDASPSSASPTKFIAMDSHARPPRSIVSLHAVRHGLEVGRVERRSGSAGAGVLAKLMLGLAG
ncbi:MAG: ArnT family glycosyltransferase [Solirubrobacteraceae bacterium]